MTRRQAHRARAAASARGVKRRPRTYVWFRIIFGPGWLEVDTPYGPAWTPTESAEPRPFKLHLKEK